MYILHYFNKTGLVNLITTSEMPLIKGCSSISVSVLPAYKNDQFLYVENGEVILKNAPLEEGEHCEYVGDAYKQLQVDSASVVEESEQSEDDKGGTYEI